jgi:hypothetical protein
MWTVPHPSASVWEPASGPLSGENGTAFGAASAAVTTMAGTSLAAAAVSSSGIGLQPAGLNPGAAATDASALVLGHSSVLKFVRDLRRYGVPVSAVLLDERWARVLGGGGAGGSWDPSRFPSPRELVAHLDDQGIALGLAMAPRPGTSPHERAGALEIARAIAEEDQFRGVALWWAPRTEEDRRASVASVRRSLASPAGGGGGGGGAADGRISTSAAFGQQHETTTMPASPLRSRYSTGGGGGGGASPFKASPRRRAADRRKLVGTPGSVNASVNSSSSITSSSGGQSFHSPLASARVDAGLSRAARRAAWLARVYARASGCLAIAPSAGPGSHGNVSGLAVPAPESSWAALALQPILLTRSVAAGSLWFHAEAGGHAGADGDPELQVRWHQLAAVAPLYRVAHAPGNAAYETRAPWDLDAAAGGAVARAARTRAALVPYLYTTAYEAHVNSVPPLRPMWIRWDDGPIIELSVN